MYQGQNRKVVLIGTGMVGMSYAYALLNQNVCDELVLIDIDKKRAMGEAMDLNHGLAFSGSNMKIYAGDYSDCANADIVSKTGEILVKNVAVGVMKVDEKWWRNDLAYIQKIWSRYFKILEMPEQKIVKYDEVK